MPLIYPWRHLMELLGQGISLSAILVLVAAVLAGCSGIPGLFLGHRPGSGQSIASVLLLTAAGLGVPGSVIHLLRERTESFIIHWTLPFGPAELTLDPLAAIFLIPVFLVGGCVGLYAVGYWPAGQQRGSEARLSFSVGIMISSVVLVVTARNSALFLIGWELMALSNFFAMTVSDRDPEVREAGLVYIVVTHLATLVLIVMFALLKATTGSFLFPSVSSLDPHAPFAAAIFLTGLVSFGAKAGLMPLHIWLPAAHASAPSHVSALMSGVMLKMGIYGLIRLLSFYQTPPLWWGGVILVVGIVSGIAGVMFAIGQHDIKRLLAYHSIENVGIIAMGIGLAVIGRSIGSSSLEMLGIAGALLHTVNHATFKALLFLGAGSIIHAAETREIDRMGGLLRRLPWTSASFLIGSVAICGLPPLNGFISEFFVYLGAFRGLTSSDTWIAALPAIVAPALALIGSLATACFVKVFGIAFLGLPRTRSAAECHESGWQMRAPQIALSVVCIGIGLLPFGVAPVLESAAFCWNPELGEIPHRLSGLAPLGWLAFANAILLILSMAICLIIYQRMKLLPRHESVTWDCGYLAPSPRMQYTASSFADILVRLTSSILRPQRHDPQVSGLFPKSVHCESHVPEALLELCYLPLIKRAQLIIGPLRKLQHGQLNIYVLYILLSLVLLLIWSRW